MYSVIIIPQLQLYYSKYFSMNHMFNNVGTSVHKLFLAINNLWLQLSVIYLQTLSSRIWALRLLLEEYIIMVTKISLNNIIVVLAEC